MAHIELGDIVNATPDGSDNLDLSQIRTAPEFSRALSSVRERAGLTVREAAGKAGVPNATAGDYFSGAHLPGVRQSAALTKLLIACGVTDPQRIDEWQAVATTIRRAPGPSRAGDPAPFRGLECFRPEDAKYFKGRDGLIAEIVGRLITTRRARGRGMTVVVGPSGSGKSSVLRAGLIPAIARGDLAVPGSAQWPVVHFAPGSNPRKVLHEHLAAATVVGPSGSAPGLVVVVDQFEEVFTSCQDEDERHGFINALCAMAGSTADGNLDLDGEPWPPALVVLGLRADYYGHALRYPRLAAVAQAAQVVVAPMTKAELREAIVEPARLARTTLEEGLVELLLSDLAPNRTNTTAALGVGALPLLSHALRSTWERRERGRMTVAHYRATGGIEGSVSQSAETVLEGLTEGQRELARTIFIQLVNIAEDGSDTRRRVSHEQIRMVAGEAKAGDVEDSTLR